MLKTAHKLAFATLLFALLGFTTGAAHAQSCGICTTPMPTFTTTVTVSAIGNNNPNYFPATSGRGFISATIGPWQGGNMPPVLPAGTYQAWCGTKAGDPFQTPSGAFTATSDTNALASQTPSISATTLSEINYILDNKQGVPGGYTPSVEDVQWAIWAVLGTKTDADLTNTGHYAGHQLYQAALSNPAWTPGPGQVTAVVLLSGNSSSYQNLLVEAVNCGSLGDRVWLQTKQDTGGNFITYQQFTGTTPSDPGINGVQLQLLDGTGNPVQVNGQNVIVTTGPSPFNYPYLPAGSNGYYQFTGLQACSYQVQVLGGAPLTGLTFGPTQNSTSISTDSNPNPSAAPAVAISTNPWVDETIDFGYHGNPPLNITCPPSIAYAGKSYTTDFAAPTTLPSNAVYLAVTGGTTPYSYSATGLPAGLTLNSDGSITGSPTTNGIYSVVFNVNGTTQSCPITVNPPLVRVGCPTSSAQALAAYTSQIAASGGTAPYNFSLSYASTAPLPPGLSITSSGSVSGTPTTPGTYPFTILASDSTGSSLYVSARSCSITVAPANPALSCPTATANVTVAYDSYALGTGGTSPYSYAITSGSLPAGLTLNASTGEVSGTPTTAQAYSYTVTMTDAAQKTSSASCSITVGQRFTPSCPANTATAGATYISSITTSGGSGPFGYAVTTGSMPSGLTIGATGSVTGAPGTAGTYNYSLTVTDQATTPPTPETVSCTMKVALTATCVSATTGVVGTAYSSAMTAVGASGTATFSNPVGLPPGLSMASNGSITGTPTTAGTYNFSVTLTDAAGNSVTVNCSITITTVVTAQCMSINAIQGTAITPVTLSAAGGSGGYTFTATGLPTGLSISSSGIVSGTPSVTGTFNYTVTIKDSNGQTGNANCTVTVVPPIVSTCPIINSLLGAQMTPVQMTATGGTGLNFQFSAAGLPPGMTISTNGVISGTPTVGGLYSYTITITDSAGNKGSVSCTTIVPSPKANCVSILAVIGTPIAPATLIGYDGIGGPYTFSAIGLPAGLTMTSGGTISGTPTVTGTFSYITTVTDRAGNIGTVNCSITVNPLPSANCVTINATQGVAITPVTLQPTGGTGTGYTFSASGLPAGLTMSPTGTISGTPTVNGTYSYTITIKDGAGNTGTVNCSVTVALPNLTLSCPTATGVFNTSYASSLVASGGTQPYTYSIASGSLPGGVTLNASTGAISGTPTAGGTSSFTAKVTDASGQSVATTTASCSIGVTYPTVTANCVTITAVQGVAITPVTMTATGGSGTGYTFSATGLPAGLTMTASGTISGTPTVNGTYSYTVTITDSANNTGTVNCSVTVGMPTLTLSCPTGAGVFGSSYTSTLVATGGNAPYSYSIASGNLPSGVTLNASTGVITGTIGSGGTASFTAKVVDASNQVAATATSSCSIGVTYPAISANCVTINAVMGTAITPVTLQASGGSGKGYSFSATGLPTGLTIASNGTISGIPTVNGTFNYTVTITDDAGNQGTLNCSVTVTVPPVSATCVTIVAVQGVAITPVTMTASGGTGTGYTFSASGLPAGLSMSGAGIVSGTPTVNGTFNYTVTVTDGSGNKGTFNCSVTIAPPPVSATCVTIVASQGVAITPVTMTATGGTGTGYTFSASGLPAGLTMSGSGTISGTPTASGTFNYTVTVTDGSGNKGTFNCSVNVTPAPALQLSCPANGYTGYAKTAYTFPAITPAGGVPPYTFYVATPAYATDPSLTMSYTGGIVTGTPDQAGTFTLGVQDSLGTRVAPANCSYAFTNQFIPPPAQLAVVKTPKAGTFPMNGQATFQIVVSNPAASGAAAATNVKLTDTLPTNGGMTWTSVTPSSNCALAGNVLSCTWASLAAASSVTVTVSSPATTPTSACQSQPNPAANVSADGGLTATDSGSLSCAAPTALAIICPSNTAIVGVPYSSPVATGGAAPYTFSLVSGTLPPGMTLNAATGQMTGTPVVGGNYSFQIKVTDSLGATATSAGCTMTIATPPVPICGGDTATIGYWQNKNGQALILAVNGGPTATALSAWLVQQFPILFGPTSPYNLTDDTNAQVASTYLTVFANDKTFAQIFAGALAAYVTNSGLAGGTYAVPYGFNYGAGGTGGKTYSTGTSGTTLGLANNTTYTLMQMLQAANQAQSTSPDSNAANVLFTNINQGGDIGTGGCGGMTPLTMTCAAGTAVVGMPYSSAVTANGGVGAYTFTIVSGALPAGLSLNSTTGAITGTPTGAPGTATYVVQVTDSQGNTAQTTGCSITVYAAVTANCVTINAVQGVAITPVTMTASGGSGTGYTFSANGLPAGLTMSSTGTISGTPTVTGTFTYTVTIKDSLGNTGTVNCSITVNAGCSGTCVTINAIQGVPITPVTMPAAGGTGSGYTFSATGLPAGLTMSSTGTISGTPTVSGTFNYTVTVKDSAGTVGTINCSVTVAPPVSATCAGINAVQNVTITSVTMTAGGGAGAPYTFSATGLPTGLSISTGGTISGTPTVSGIFNYTVTVKDKNGNAGTANCTVTVTPAATALTLTCPLATTGTIGTAYSSSVTAAGGTAPYTFAMATGALPPGLTLNSATGAITGTPTTGGSFAFTIKVTDSKGAVALSSCTSACGGSVAWNLSAPAGNLGTSQAYTLNNLTVNAYGYTGTTTGTAAALYGNDAGGDLYGLGIAGVASNQIDNAHFVTIDVSAITAAGGSNAQIVVAGASGTDTFSIFGSNTLGSIGTKLTTGGASNDLLPISIALGTYKYISVQANTGAVLLNQVSFAVGSCNITISGTAIVFGDAATIGFWHNKNGQALINAMPSSPNLGNWLANTFPYLYGPSSSTNLTNASNATVAGAFMNLFTGDKTGAQIMAGALASYVTSSTLGGTGATAYGFNSSAQGTGGKLYNVGSSGSAIGLVNNTNYTVLHLLQQVNTSKANGTYSTQSGTFNVIFSGINQTGDIQ